MPWLAEGCHYAFPDSQENTDLFEQAQARRFVMQCVVLQPEGQRLNIYADPDLARELPLLHEKVEADLGRGAIAGHGVEVRETHFPSAF